MGKLLENASHIPCEAFFMFAVKFSHRMIAGGRSRDSEELHRRFQVSVIPWSGWAVMGAR